MSECEFCSCRISIKVNSVWEGCGLIFGCFSLKIFRANVEKTFHVSNTQAYKTNEDESGSKHSEF